MERLQKQYILNDLKEKYVFMGGPRQGGKTTFSKQLFGISESQYLNYDRDDDRKIMIKGAWNRQAKLIILDEFHKYPKWKTFLKGYYDTEGNKPPLLITGSAKLNIFKKGNDSMAGRYFYHRLLPFSVKELENEISADKALAALLMYGNFPEPFLKQSERSSKRWRQMTIDRIVREDVTDLSNIRDLPKIRLLIDLLKQRVGSTVSYASLAQDLEVAPKTVKTWIELLEQLYLVFRITPYHNNIARSLLKEPKIYFFDSGMGANSDSHLENLVAVSLLKHLWFLEDTEGVETRLYYLRTKEGHEIDFVMIEDGKVTQVIEVKKSDSNFHKPFFHFQRFLPADVQYHQLVMDLRHSQTVKHVQIESVSAYLKNLMI